MDSEWRQKVLYNRRCRAFVANWLGSDFELLFSDQRPQKRKRPGVIYSRRAKTPEDFTTTAWMQLIRNPLTRQRGSYFGKLFRNRFRIPFSMFMKLRNMFVEHNWLQTRRFDCFGRPSVPFEMKLLAALRFLGRGECFDTLSELTGDRVSAETIRRFVIEFVEKMSSLKDKFIRTPDPTNNDEMKSAMDMYARLGFPGCIGSTDCVNIALSRCPHSLKNIHTGKDGYPTLGFNCTVNHHRRFLHVSRSCPGSWNDKCKVRFDQFCCNVREQELYKQIPFQVRTSTGEWVTRRGVYLIVDGGYHRWRILQCPLKQSSDKKECLHSRWLESVRKDVECAFGVLKVMFRCLKLPSRFQNLTVTENIFITCCILRNMLMDDELEQREEQLSGVFCEEEDLINWIRQSKHYRSDSVSYQFGRVLRRSETTTDLSSTGDVGIREDDDDNDDVHDETESGWKTLHKILVDHFYFQWCSHQLEWTGCRQPVREDRVIELMRSR